MKTLSLILVLLCAGPAWAGIELSEAYPRAGQPVNLTITGSSGAAAAHVEVKASYGPGSELIREVSLGRTDNRGVISWTPEEAGLVTLSAEIPTSSGDPEAVSSTVSVRFAGPPMLGILVMIVAGLILYGGVIRGFRALSRPVPSFPPDT